MNTCAEKVHAVQSLITPPPRPDADKKRWIRRWEILIWFIRLIASQELITSQSRFCTQQVFSIITNQILSVFDQSMIRCGQCTSPPLLYLPPQRGLYHTNKHTFHLNGDRLTVHLSTDCHCSASETCAIKSCRVWCQNKLHTWWCTAVSYTHLTLPTIYSV